MSHKRPLPNSFSTGLPAKRAQNIPASTRWSTWGVGRLCTTAQPGASSTFQIRVALFSFFDGLISLDESSQGWQWWCGSVPIRLTRLHHQGFKLVAICTEEDLPTGARGVAGLARLIEEVCCALVVPLSVVVTPKFVIDFPSFLVELPNVLGAVGINYDASFACTPTEAQPPPLDLAGSAGVARTDQPRVRWVHPEEYFLGERLQTQQTPKANAHQPPQDVGVSATGLSALAPLPPTSSATAVLPLSVPKVRYAIDVQQEGAEIVLLCGPPGAGKTTFARREFVSQGYIHVNQDRLGSRDRCVQNVKDAMTRKQSCIIDNTNPDQHTRALYIKAAATAGVPVRCFWLDTPIAVAQQRDKARAKAEQGPTLPQDAFTKYVERFSGPHIMEGFTEIHRVAHTEGMVTS